MRSGWAGLDYLPLKPIRHDPDARMANFMKKKIRHVLEKVVQKCIFMQQNVVIQKVIENRDKNIFLTPPPSLYPNHKSYPCQNKSIFSLLFLWEPNFPNQKYTFVGTYI